MHRIFATVICTTLAAVTFQVEFFMSLFGLETAYGSVCTDIIMGTGFPLAIVGMIMIFASDVFTSFPNSWRSLGTAFAFGAFDAVGSVWLTRGALLFAQAK